MILQINLVECMHRFIFSRSTYYLVGYLRGVLPHSFADRFLIAYFFKLETIAIAQLSFRTNFMLDILTTIKADPENRNLLELRTMCQMTEDTSSGSIEIHSETDTMEEQLVRNFIEILSPGQTIASYCNIVALSPFGHPVVT